MAYEISMWQKDGDNGEAQIKAIRINKVSEIQEIIDYWSSIPDCVRITKDRTSQKDQLIRTLWIRPGYKDPFE